MGALLGVLGALICYWMAVSRESFEPIIRTLHPLLLGRRGGKYEPEFYIAYEIWAGVVAATPFVGLALARLTYARTNKKIDKYLAERLPHHEIVVSRREE